MSCIFFIVSIDPEIRNIISSREIKMIRLITPRTLEKIELKAGAYVDDVLVVYVEDNESVNGIFKQYERLTRKSGLELNVEKTENLSMHSDRPRTYDVQYCVVQTST